MKTRVIMREDGYTADTHFDLGGGSHLRRLLEGGVIRPAEQRDRDVLATRERVSYSRSGAGWGSGEYVLSQADELYVTDNGFNLGHVELAIRHMLDQDLQAKRNDLYSRIDGARCPTCGR